MSVPHLSEPDFLQNATPEQLGEAAAWNHRELFVCEALASGGEVQEAEGVTWTYTGPQGEAMILFPRLQEASAGEQLDNIMQYYLDRRPEKLVGCWSLDPLRPRDLEVRLLARGFQLGWRPCWMVLDLQKMKTDQLLPNGLEVAQVEDSATWEVEELPYYNAEMAARRHAVTRIRPQRMWRFAARLNGKIVGHSTLFLTTGRLGVAGIYDVGVVPEARNRGVGKAVTLAACLQAREMGGCYALLNATGERMYRQIGFERIGYGWTWWLNVPRLESRPPTQEQIALAEAIGRCDLEALSALGQRSCDQDLETPLPNGMTLLQLAVHAKQSASVEWLVRQGSVLDVVSAWDLGWKNRVPQLLAQNPELANQRLGEMQVTPLHVAAERNDIELARVVLAAHPDLEIKDGAFHSTALGWARHFQHAEIVRLIEGHLQEKS